MKRANANRPAVLAAAVLAALAALLLALGPASAATGGIVARGAAGPDAADVQGALDAFRADLGGQNNGNGGTFPDGRREINWDGAPDTASAPNNMAPDAFRGRGAIFSTPGSGFQLSADSSNPTGTPARFGNLNATYTTTFAAFSPERLFTALGSNITDVTFVMPGTSTSATVDGFGAIFTDVDSGTGSRLQYYDKDGNLLLEQNVPNVADGNASFSFAGATFDSARVARVRITSGTVALGQPDGLGGSDAVAMDDFVYGEPQEIKAPPPPPPANTRPAITPISPDPGSKTRDDTPAIRAKVTDKETDLAKANIRLYLDGKAKGFAYDRATDRLSFVPKGGLDRGKHEVRIVARDGGGLSAAGSWSFRVTRDR